MTSNPPIPVRAFAGVLLIVQVFAVNAADLSRPTILSQPYDFEVVISNTVTSCVTAAGTEPLAYQWRKGATALPGQTNRCLVITNAQLAHEGGYRVVVRNSFGAVTSAVATVTVVIPPKITQQPVGTNAAVGNRVFFSAKATGDPSPHYQWQRNGVSIFRATGSTLVLSNVQISSAGAYRAMIFNSAGTIYSAEAILDVRPELTRPTLTVSTPTNNTRLTNASVIVRGTARDNVLVTQVVYRVGGQVLETAISESPGNWSNWTANVTLAPGSNSFTAIARDSSGNSSTNTRNYFYVVRRPVQWTLGGTGRGTVKGATNGQMLEIGKSYKLTATNSPGSRFIGWTGSTNSTNAVLKFLMRDPFAVQANFADVQRPTVAITAPAANSRPSNAVVTVRGTARDNVLLKEVFYQVNNGPFQSASGTTNWTTPVMLQPGTNVIRARSVDAAGNVSLTNSVKFVYAGSGALRQPLRIGNTFSISVATVSGKQYVLEYKNSLSDPNWTALPAVTGDNTIKVLTDPNASVPHRFYRVIER